MSQETRKKWQERGEEAMRNEKENATENKTFGDNDVKIRDEKQINTLLIKRLTKIEAAVPGKSDRQAHGSC